MKKIMLLLASATLLSTISGCSKTLTLKPEISVNSSGMIVGYVATATFVVNEKFPDENLFILKTSTPSVVEIIAPKSIKGIGPGKAEIFATYEGVKSNVCTINVVAVQTKPTFTFEKRDMYVGDTEQIVITNLEEFEAPRNVSYYLADGEDRISISPTGLVTALKPATHLPINVIINGVFGSGIYINISPALVDPIISIESTTIKRSGSGLITIVNEDQLEKGIGWDTKWFSSNRDIIIPTQTLFPIGIGTCDIWMTWNGRESNRLTITVIPD